MPCLRIKLPDNKGESTHVLAGQRITLGRRPDNTIQIIHLSVSGHHAELIFSGDHYLLHDLGSTNLTCVNEKPVTDFHLHQDCRVMFGSVECEFSIQSPPLNPDGLTEVVPTRADLEFLRRENLDLLSKLATQQKQIDILSSARLITTQTTQLGIAPEAHRRVVAQRDELRTENQSLKRDMENFKADLIAITRDRDAMRQAWETVKNEVGGVRAELAGLKGSRSAEAAVVAPVLLPTVAAPEPPAGPQAPVAAAAILESLRQALVELRADAAHLPARESAMAAAGMLRQCLLPLAGQPAQRLATAISSLFGEIAHTEGALEASALRTLSEAAVLLGRLLEPGHFGRPQPMPHVLAIDGDAELLATLGAALEFGEIETTRLAHPSEAAAHLEDKEFDLIFLEAGTQPDSLAACEGIRAALGARKTPLVFLAASDSPDPLTEGNLRCGNDFLQKPINIVELILKAHTWVYRHQFGLIP